MYAYTRRMLLDYAHLASLLTAVLVCLVPHTTCQAQDDMRPVIKVTQLTTYKSPEGTTVTDACGQEYAKTLLRGLIGTNPNMAALCGDDIKVVTYPTANVWILANQVNYTFNMNITSSGESVSSAEEKERACANTLETTFQDMKAFEESIPGTSFTSISGIEGCSDASMQPAQIFTLSTELLWMIAPTTTSTSTTTTTTRTTTELPTTSTAPMTTTTTAKTTRLTTTLPTTSTEATTTGSTTGVPTPQVSTKLPTASVSEVKTTEEDTTISIVGTETKSQVEETTTVDPEVTTASGGNCLHCSSVFYKVVPLGLLGYLYRYLMDSSLI